MLCKPEAGLTDRGVHCSLAGAGAGAEHSALPPRHLRPQRLRVWSKMSSDAASASRSKTTIQTRWSKRLHAGQACLSTPTRPQAHIDLMTGSLPLQQTKLVARVVTHDTRAPGW